MYNSYTGYPPNLQCKKSLSRRLHSAYGSRQTHPIAGGLNRLVVDGGASAPSHPQNSRTIHPLFHGHRHARPFNFRASRMVDDCQAGIRSGLEWDAATSFSTRRNTTTKLVGILRGSGSNLWVDRCAKEKALLCALMKV